MVKSIVSFIIGTFLLSGCIGTNYVDDPIVGAMVQIDSPRSSLLIGQTIQLQANFYDDYGIEQANVSFDWISDDESVEVDDTGLARAVSIGQSNIYASRNGAVSPTFLLTVVGTENDVASVEVDAPKSNLAIGESIQLTYTLRNFMSETVQSSETPIWTSSDLNLLSVSGSGVVEGIRNGLAEIVCRVEEVNSPPLLLSVGEQARTGTFIGNGYTAEGTAMLSYNESDELILSLSSDFKTSFALGTFIYLSNNTGGGVTRSSGLEIQEITTNGAKSFNVTDIDASVSLTTYDYVIILCKPASLTFGYAELTP